MEKKYWQSIEEYYNEEKSNSEAIEQKHKDDVLGLQENEYALKASRRDFLKYFGFSLTAATLAAGCDRPVQKAIPYLIKPEEITPGKANFYASTFFDGDTYCSILVKVRDGRPIKIEGNELSKITEGGTSARVQASVLDLYDIARPQFPTKEGKQITWKQADAEIIPALQNIQETGGKIVLLSSTIISPATKQVISDFQKKYPGVQHVTYDAVSSSAILQASEINFGAKFIPDYRFENADLVVAFNADFLGTWLSPVEYTRKYMKKRRLTDGQKQLSHHIQFETNFTITGSKADKRFPIKPSDEKIILAGLYNALVVKSGGTAQTLPKSPVDLDFLADEILSHKGKSIIVSGSNDLECQLLVNAINNLAGSYGSTISLSEPSYIRQGIDTEMNNLVREMNDGKVASLIIVNANPIYDYHDKAFTEGLKKVKLSVSLSDKKDETSKAVQYFCPDHHFLESWNDAEPQKGHFSLMQPVIQPLFNTRQAQETLLKWSGSEISYYDYVRNFWETEIYKYSDTLQSPDKFWSQSLRDGVFETNTGSEKLQFKETNIKSILSGIKPSNTKLEAYFYESVAIGSGKHTNNPWLTEMPDPMTKVCWDNFVSVSPRYAQEKGWKNGTVVKINGTAELPVIVQPGHAYGAISIALGFGHTEGGKVASGLGTNAYPFIKTENGNRLYFSEITSLEATGVNKVMALSQLHDSMEGRPIVRECDLSEYVDNPSAGNEIHAEFEKKHLTLYDDPKFDGYHWGLMVDLNACTSCGACIIACQAENNIPVVGREQVAANRIMHWIRLDRYYSDEPENPKVMHQPVMCQHCDQAPCENVCPVSATSHSNEGLNQVTYNRCIGTKYCINNCPYKVRRFNWFKFVQNDKFDYNMNSDLGRMVLNPDVTVRERGVVEKCSFCVQRIQEKKLTAKLENRTIEDGELKTACVQACPSGALIFGNMKDSNSRVSKMKADPRNYHLLEELHTLPSVGYLTLVRNTKEKKA
jgi:molybdopterin-containing oxidoreductase family iron-sulfur binding subunit